MNFTTLNLTLKYLSTVFFSLLVLEKTTPTNAHMLSLPIHIRPALNGQFSSNQSNEGSIQQCADLVLQSNNPTEQTGQNLSQPESHFNTLPFHHQFLPQSLQYQPYNLTQNPTPFIPFPNPGPYTTNMNFLPTLTTHPVPIIPSTNPVPYAHNLIPAPSIPTQNPPHFIPTLNSVPYIIPNLNTFLTHTPNHVPYTSTPVPVPQYSSSTPIYYPQQPTILTFSQSPWSQPQLQPSLIQNQCQFNRLQSFIQPPWRPLCPTFPTHSSHNRSSVIDQHLQSYLPLPHTSISIATCNSVGFQAPSQPSSTLPLSISAFVNSMISSSGVVTSAFSQNIPVSLYCSLPMQTFPITQMTTGGSQVLSPFIAHSSQSLPYLPSQQTFSTATACISSTVGCRSAAEEIPIRMFVTSCPGADGHPAPKKQRQRSPETQYSQSQINPVPLDIQPSPHYHAPNVEVCTSNVDTFINYIKQKYSVRVVERDEKWSLSPTVEYINLACIDRRCVKKSAEYEEVTKAMVQDGNVDTIIGKKRSIQFNEIAAEIYLPSEAMAAKTHPEPVGDKRLILVEGAPGAGKSTFAWEFCRRWERGEIAQQYDLVLLLRLRDKGTKNAKGLEQLIRHPLEGVSAAVCHELVDSHTFHALIILEGYDELPDSLRNDSSSIFNELISGELLPLATILVTSRPWATMDIRKKYERRIYQHLEVLGFAKRQITQYIKKTVPKDKVSGLNSYLERHPQIRSCMYIPLNSAIVVAVYEASTNDQKPMPNTLTELYISVMKIIIKRHLIGHPDLCGDGERNLSSIDMSVPLKVEENFYHLCKLAYDGILNEKDEITLVFSELELPPNFDNLGFMDSVTELYVTVETSTSHNFLHLTFQEFFAAVHISGMSPEKQVEYFRSGSGGKGGRLKVVLKFLAGLNKLDCISGEIVSHFFETPVSSKGNKYEIFPTITVNIDIVNWMFETQSDNTISLILHKKNIIEFQFNNEEMLLTLQKHKDLMSRIFQKSCNFMFDY